MARGFESKDVEYQQDEATRRQPPRPASTPAERQRDARRHSVELALANARAERASATNPAHQRMLDQAVQALEDELRTHR